MGSEVVWRVEVSFEKEKFEDKIDYDERSELPSFDCVFDLSMLDDWEDNLVDNELNGLRIAKSKRLRKKIKMYM